MPLFIHRLLLLSAFSVPLCGCLHQARLKPYAGQWILRSDGQNLMVMQTRFHRGKITGTITSPKNFTEEADGSFSDVKPPISTRTVIGKMVNRKPIFLIGEEGDRDRLPARMSGNDELFLLWASGQVPEWHFHRVPLSPVMSVAREWPQSEASP